MATGNEQQFIDGNLQVVPGPAVERLRTYGEDETESLIQALVADGVAGIPASFMIANPCFIGIGGPAGDTYSATSSDPEPKRAFAAVLEKRDRNGAFASAKWGLARWRQADPGFTSVPFKGLGGETVQIGIRINDYPTGATTDTSGTHYLDRWNHGIGERAVPNSVADLSPGLRLEITDTAIWRAWSAVGSSRPCVVWLNNPATSTGDAFEVGQLQSDGADVYVQVPHYFGQSSPSLTPSDYSVHVFGLTISDKAAFDQTTQETNGVGTYVTLLELEISGLVGDSSAQIVVPSLQALSLISLFDVNPIPRSLRQGLRAGLYIGDYEDHKEWNDPANVIVDTVPDPIEITFTNPFGPTGSYIFTGQEQSPYTSLREFRMCSNFVFLGNIATLSKSEPSGTYVIVAESQLAGPTPAGEAYAIQLRILPLGGGTGDFEERELLHIWTFDFTTGTGAVSSIVPDDLSRKRGISDGTLWGDGTDGGGSNFKSPILRELIGAESLSVHLRNAADPTYTINEFARLERDIGSTNGILQLFSKLGPGNNLDAEKIEFRLGGDSDYWLRAAESGGIRSFSVRDLVLTYIQHLRTGGEGGGTTDRWLLNDLHLSDAGKIVTRMVPLEGGNGHTQGWGAFTAEPNVPRWGVGQRNDETTNSGVEVSLAEVRIAEAFGVGVDETFAIRALLHIEETDGDNLDFVRIDLWSNAGGTIDTIWASDVSPYNASHNESDGDLAYVEVQAWVSDNTAGSGKAVCTYPEATYDNSVPLNPSPFGTVPAQYTSRVKPLYTATVNWETDVFVRVRAKWATGGGAQVLRLERFEVLRDRTDLWRGNTSDGWRLAQGDSRQLLLPLPVNVANGHRLVDASVWCGVGTGGSSTCRLSLDLREYDPTTGSSSSLLAAPVVKEDNSFAAPVVLTCSPATPLMTAGKRYFIRVVSEQSSAGGTFSVRHAEFRTRLHQIQ